LEERICFESLISNLHRNPWT